LNWTGGGVQIEPEGVRHYMSCTFVGLLHHIVAGKRGGRGHFETSNNSGVGAARNRAEICKIFFTATILSHGFFVRISYLVLRIAYLVGHREKAQRFLDAD